MVSSSPALGTWTFVLTVTSLAVMTPRGAMTSRGTAGSKIRGWNLPLCEHDVIASVLGASSVDHLHGKAQINMTKHLLHPP